MADYLLPIAERDALRWIIGEQRTAFPPHRTREADRLAIGDAILLYTTRGCFHNPTRDRGRVIGDAAVRAPARTVDPPIAIAGVEYPHLVELEIRALTPFRSGVELAPLVPELPSTFPDPASWSVWMRRAVLRLDAADAGRLRALLRELAKPYDEVRGGYLK